MNNFQLPTNPRRELVREVTGKPWQGDTGRMDGALPARSEGMTEKRMRACTLSNFPSPLRNLRHLPSLPSPLHYHQIIFFKLAHARGSVSFHSAQIFLLPFAFLACSQSTDWYFPSGCQLWTSSPPTLSRILLLFRNGIQLETMQCAPRQLFSFTGWDHTYWTGGIYHTVKHLTTYAPRILNNNQKEFVDACIRIQGGRGRGQTDIPYPYSLFTTSLSRTKC